MICWCQAIKKMMASVVIHKIYITYNFFNEGDDVFFINRPTFCFVCCCFYNKLRMFLFVFPDVWVSFIFSLGISLLLHALLHTHTHTTKHTHMYSSQFAIFIGEGIRFLTKIYRGCCHVNRPKVRRVKPLNTEWPLTMSRVYIKLWRFCSHPFVYISAWNESL